MAPQTTFAPSFLCFLGRPLVCRAFFVSGPASHTRYLTPPLRIHYRKTAIVLGHISALVQLGYLLRQYAKRWVG